MKITVEIDTANDAFGNTPHEVGSQVCTILTTLARHLREAGAPGSDHKRLFDLNGNKVGSYRTSEWDHEGDEY